MNIPVEAPRRAALLPERHLPESAELIEAGRDLAREVTVGACAFLDEYGVDNEAQYKRACMREARLMLHAQIGYRDAAKTRRAMTEIHERLAAEGIRLDRYGICLDWSMGYPRDRRPRMPRGTGLILDGPEDFAALTAASPAAPHFGDFVIGTPAALENTAAALSAGATVIGNLGQYFTFRQPHWDDDVATTAETVKAIALVAAQPTEVIVHSNLDDGFAATFHDTACALGAVLLERQIVEELLGARVGHCYGHTFSDPLSRLAFQRALAECGAAPGTMVYGNTTSYAAGHAANFAALATYLLVDIAAQRTLPTGHAVNAVPVTEADRIPEVSEIIDAQRFAARLAERATDLEALLAPDAADALASRLVGGARTFRDNVLDGLRAGGVDVRDPVELLLALRRAGSRRLEICFGPGRRAAGEGAERRVPLVPSTALVDLAERARATVEAIDERARGDVAAARLVGCVATTDVHEYGKVMVESALRALGVELADAGVSTDPERLAAHAESSGADFIALSTYNGVALDFLTALQSEMSRRGMRIPVFVGGKLNQIPEASNTSLPVDVSAEIARAGAVPCRELGDMLPPLVTLAAERRGQ